jgi:hypothetical protein
MTASALSGKNKILGSWQEGRKPPTHTPNCELVKTAGFIKMQQLMANPPCIWGEGSFE